MKSMLVAGQGGPTTHPAGIAGSEGGTVPAHKDWMVHSCKFGAWACAVLIEVKGFHSLLGRASLTLGLGQMPPSNAEKTKKL